MDSKTTVLLCSKALLQLALFAATLVRYNAFSLVYLLFLLVTPLVPFRQWKKLLAYHLILIISSALFTIAQGVFQIVLAVYQPYGSIVADCSIDLIFRQIGIQPLNDTELYHLIRLIIPDPCILIIAAASLTLISSRRAEYFPESVTNSAGSEAASSSNVHGFVQQQQLNTGEFSDGGIVGSTAAIESCRRSVHDFSQWLLHVLYLCLMCSVAICSPSLLSCIYLLTFVLVMLLWTTNTLGYQFEGLNRLRKFLAFYTAIRLICTFIYQFPSVPSVPGIMANSTNARLLGLYYLVQSNCSSPHVEFSDSVSLTEYAEPMLMLAFYFYICLLVHLYHWDPYRRQLILPAAAQQQQQQQQQLIVEVLAPDSDVADQSDGSYSPTFGKDSELQCLLDDDHRHQAAAAAGESTPLYQSTSRVVLHSQSTEAGTTAAATVPRRALSEPAPLDADIDVLNKSATAPADSRNTASTSQLQQQQQQQQQQTQQLLWEEAGARLKWRAFLIADWLVRGLIKFRLFLMGVSYILTLVTMMSWSVTYVSLMTLPYLLLACILWVTPRTRRSTLTLSPLLVTYATALVLANFAFNFNLPDVFKAGNNATWFWQIGLQTYDTPLLTFSAQIAFTCVFYFTMWTFVQERRYGIPSAATAAYQLYRVRSATYPEQQQQQQSITRSTANNTNNRTKKIETLIIEVMSKYSLIICCVFWVLMCSRSEVNVSHVIVMTIFLYFILTFRLCYNFWRRQLIVCFWIIIIYSMVVLLLIYAYQFDSVPEFIIRITGLQPQILKEIGIEKYETPQLFLNLLFPTSFIIVIIIHVKNFHATFLQLTEDVDSGRRHRLTYRPSVGDDEDDEEANAEGRSSYEASPYNSGDDEEEEADAVDGGAEAGREQRAATGGSSTGAAASAQFGIGAAPGQRMQQRQRRSEANRSAPIRRALKRDLDSMLSKANKIYKAYSRKFSPTVWRIMEVHWYKIVGLIIVCTATKPIVQSDDSSISFASFDASNLPYIALLPLYLMLPNAVSIFYLIWSAFLILAKMIYQLELVNSRLLPYFVQNCSAANSSDNQPNKSSSATIAPHLGSDTARYFGLFEPAHGDFFSHIILYICIAIALAVQHIIQLKQQRRQPTTAAETAAEGIIFVNFKFSSFNQFYKRRMDADSPLPTGSTAFTLLKLLANFGCYKFGLEATCVMLVVCSCLRLDAFSCVYMLFLLMFILLSRQRVRRVWAMFNVALAICFIIQFCLACGLPPILCQSYPWFNADNYQFFTDNVRQWLYLPAYNVPPRAEKLIVDYLLLVMVTCQRRVFKIELSPPSAYDSSNEPVWEDVSTETKLRYSFINSKSGEVLALLYKITFCWLFWICPFLLLLLGFLSFNLSSFLYILAAFYLIGKGHRFLLQHRTRLLRVWNLTLLLNAVVMLCKCCLQLVGCSQLNANTQSWVQQLFGIQCLNMRLFNDYLPINNRSVWDSTINNPGIVMDIVCFVLLIMQKRVFLTEYFTEVRLDAEIQNSFTSKGARIMTMNLRRQKLENMKREQFEVEYIRLKVLHLKSRKRQKNELNEHFQVIRSGTKDLFYTTDASGRKHLSIEDDNLDEMDPQQQPTAAETLIEQGLSRASEFAQQPTKVIRRTFENLGSAAAAGAAANQTRRQSRAMSLADDQQHQLLQLQQQQQMRDLIDGNNLALREDLEEEEEEDGEGEGKRQFRRRSQTDSAASGSQYRLQLQDHRVETERKKEEEVEEQEEEEAEKEKEVFVRAEDEVGQEEVEEEVEEEEGKESESESGQSGLCSSCWRSSMHRLMQLLQLLCLGLDRITVDYRNIKEQMMLSKMAAKSARLNAAESSNCSRIELVISANPQECIDENGTSTQPNMTNSSASPPPPLPEPTTMSQALSQVMLLMQYLFFSRLTSVCYFGMIVYHLFEFTVFSLYYPLVVFTWGMLSVPYPTKRFWLATIAYTMLLILVKYVLQFAPIKQLFGLEGEPGDESGIGQWFVREMRQSDGYSTPVAELVLLAVLFLQRSSLKRYGLWNISRRLTNFLLDEAEARPSTISTTADQQQQKSPIKKSSSAAATMQAADTDNNDAEVSILRRRRPVTTAGVGADCGETEQLQLTDADADADAAASATGVEMQSIESSDSDSKKGSPDKKSSSSDSFCWNFLTLHPFREFYNKVRDPNVSVRVDLYSWMFATELLSLLIIFFGYTSGFAGSGAMGDETIITYFSTEKIPLTLTVTLFVQFLLMLVDRGLFLKKSSPGKFFFHIFHALLLHIYIKFILPAMSSAELVASSWVIKVFYITKCLYFTLSAYQILSGYPSRVLGNFICKRQNYLNLFTFKAYLLVPFLFELRSIMDWMLSKTAVSISHWLLMEDIYSVIFVSKCWRRAEIAYPTRRARNRDPCFKYCPGVWLIVLIVACIWAPLLWFSVMSSVFTEENVVTSCSSDLSIGTYTPLYTLRTTSVRRFTKDDYNTVLECFSRPKDPRKTQEATKRIKNLLDSTNAYTVEFSGMSSILWTITPPSRAALTEELRGNVSVDLNFRIDCLRAKDNGLSRRKIFNTPLQNGSSIREELLQVLTNSSLSPAVVLPQVADRFLLLRGDSQVAQQLTDFDSATNAQTKIDLQAKLNATSSSADSLSWWELTDIYSATAQCPMSHSQPPNNNETHSSLLMILFSERSKSENKLIQAVQNVGMYGILSVFLISIARILRSGIVPQHYLVMYVDMPHVDRILRLMNDIYLVRESSELELEEELFAKLLFLYRSPSMLMKYTQTPESILQQFYVTNQAD